MFRLITLAISLLSFASCLSQRFTISLQRCNRIYADVINPLGLMVEGVKCDSVFVKVTNGRITGSRCYFYYKADSIGITHIKIYIKENGRLRKIGERPLEVYSFPPPVAQIGGIYGDKIGKNQLRAQAGIGAFADPCLGFELNFTVASFETIIIRGGNAIFSSFTEGDLFSDEIHKAFDNLNSNDQLIIANIRCKFPDNSIRSAKALELTITD